MVLSDEAAAALVQQRQWARTLANKFDTTGQAASPEEQVSPRAKYEAAVAAPEQLIRRISCASEFKYRKRPWFWLVFVADAFVLWIFAIPGAVMGISYGWTAWLSFISVIAVGNFGLWLRAWPNCPNSKQNIRTCLAEHCYCCGRPIRDQRCPECGVDESWKSYFRASGGGRDVLPYWINFCPGCGVELDTWIRRLRGSD
jgi:hypothetical protein